LADTAPTARDDSGFAFKASHGSHSALYREPCYMTTL
jgi:hypothetical protein